MSDMSAKKPAMRRCVACMRSRPKSELIRVVAKEDGSLHLDPEGKSPGRGAYICREDACLNTAIKKNALRRNLKLPAGDGAADDLISEFEKIRDTHKTGGITNA